MLKVDCWNLRGGPDRQFSSFREDELRLDETRGIPYRKPGYRWRVA